MPLWLLLTPYAIFLLLFAVFALVDLANLWRYRSGFFSAAIVTIVFLAGAAAIIYGTYYLLSPLNWTQNIGINFSFTVPTAF
jgi:Kef-type K+ transport system membrane component KefB